jgi:hypothetical protein
LAVEKIKISYEVAGKKELAAINEELLQMIKKNGLLQKEIEDTIEKFKNQGKQADGLSGTLKKTANILAGVFAADKIIDFGKEVLKIRGEMQRFEAVLTNTLGSNSAAQKALKEIVKFASETPFSVSQLTDSFIKLANRGIIATNEQMRKMGDLSAALGKDFGILNEAILDVNNTERWNELGIKVKTTGDTMTGTFKGVTVEVDRTEKGALKMVETFGSFKGVAGGMAAISETLEGRISNLGDSYETLLNSIGTRTEGVFAGAIGALGDLINTTNEWVSIPASKAIASEQGELNALVQAIINTNDEERVRSGLIQELNTRFPDFLENIEDENVTNDLLRTTLEKVNDEYRKKIILQLSEEKVTEIIKGQNAAILKRIELEQKLAEQTKTKEKNPAEGYDTFDSAVDPISNLKREIKELDEELLKAQESQNALFKEFGIDPEADAKKLADKKKKDDADKEDKKKKDDADKEAKKVSAAIALEAAKEDKRREIEALKEIEKSAKEQEKEDLASFDFEKLEEELDATYDLKIEKLLEHEEKKQEIDNHAYEVGQAILNSTAEAAADRDANDLERQKTIAEAKIQLAFAILGAIGEIAGRESKIGKAAALADIAYSTGKAIAKLVEMSQANPANSVTFGAAGIAQFAAGISIIAANIAQAKSILSSAPKFETQNVNAPKFVDTPKFEKGGRIGGKRHSQGGTLIEAEINEHVMSRRATAKYGHHFFDSLNSLELRPDILNGMSGGSSPIIINSDNKELINEYRNRPITNISISENGITKRTQRNNNIIQKKLLRYKS